MNVLRNIFNKAAAEPVPTYEGPVTLPQAIEIFDHLADMKKIAFGYPQDGCYARAHLMCREIERMGQTPLKAWALEGEDTLRVITPKGDLLDWCFHVAPVLEVVSPKGTPQMLVFDPALFDGPVTLQEWGDIMKAPKDKLEIAPWGVPPKGELGDYDTVNQTTRNSDKRAANTMKENMYLQDKSQRTVFATRYRQKLADEAAEVKMQGATWVSTSQQKQFKAGAMA